MQRKVAARSMLPGIPVNSEPSKERNPMALIEWSDKLVLKVERMDETHREFVEQLNALHAAPEDEFIALLDVFIEHSVAHFEQEQRWMAELNFPPIHCHTNEHEGVLNIMREVRRMVAEGKPQVGRVLTQELAPWFENHAVGMDAMLAFFLRCVEAGVDPMQALAAQNQSVCTSADAGEPGCAHTAGNCEQHAEGAVDAAKSVQHVE
jgi:hemerythrin